MLKIISIHIPKTAGRSFYQVLKWAYKGKIDYPHNRGKYLKDDKFDDSLIDLNREEVIHGHFCFRHVKHLYQRYNPKVIVWLRNPVDRVISNYYYNISTNLQKPWKERAQIRKELTLDEFITRPNRQNTMSNFLSGINPDDIFFIGITEQFDTDLIRLGKMLNWPKPIPEFARNIGTDSYKNTNILTQYGDITDKMRRQIRDLNLDDVELYEKIAGNR